MASPKGKYPPFRRLFPASGACGELILFDCPASILGPTKTGQEDLKQARRRLSVMSDNKLVEGFDNVNLDVAEEDVSASLSPAQYSGRGGERERGDRKIAQS